MLSSLENIDDLASTFAKVTLSLSHTHGRTHMKHSLLSFLSFLCKLDCTLIRVCSFSLETGEHLRKTTYLKKNEILNIQNNFNSTFFFPFKNKSGGHSMLEVLGQLLFVCTGYILSLYFSYFGIL